MTTQTQPSGGQRWSERRTGGIVLVALGLFFLLAQFLNLGAWVLPILGLAFLTVGAVTRQAGWMIPGGILSGLALGVFMVEGPLGVAEPVAGGLFLIAFAAGWVLIYLASRLLTTDPQRWALIPAGIMALIGGLVFLAELGGPAVEQIMRLVNLGWPLILVGIGTALLVREWRKRGPGD
jgi:uncharacterized membrane protein